MSTLSSDFSNNTVGTVHPHSREFFDNETIESFYARARRAGVQKRYITELILVANRCGIREIRIYNTPQVDEFFNSCHETNLDVCFNSMGCCFLNAFCSFFRTRGIPIEYERDFPFIRMDEHGNPQVTKRSIRFSW